MSEARKSYRAFISYSQQDKVWGKRIHTWLETYRVPVGVMADVGEERRLGRFFRDEDEMPAAPDIGAVVEQAIAAAESLIVICSPCSAESKWVEGEIRAFRRTRPGGKVFAVIIDGSPNSGNPDTECFPDALRLRDDDSLDTLPIEPVGIDVRIDGKDRTCARLAAGILGVDFDDLWQRDRRRNEAQQRRMIVALSVLTLVFAALASAAVWFGVEARRHAAAAEAARANLQREYLRALGEAALDGVLALESLPGTLAMDDPATWTVLMETDEQPFAASREYGAGRMLAIAHDGVLLADMRGSGAFLRRTIGWLRGSERPQSVVIASGHCEWLPNVVPEWMLPAMLETWGYSVSRAESELDDAALAGAGVVIIGNAWGDFDANEIAAIERFTRGGGGVLMAGLEWSWREHGANREVGCAARRMDAQTPGDPSTYPMNRVAQPFGLRWAG